MNRSSSHHRLSPHELKQRMDAEGIILIDTLISDHFQNVHLPGAKNACVFEVTFLEQVAALVADKNLEIVVYGASSRTMDAETAADKLVRSGYSRVTILEEGIAGWREAGYPLEGAAVDTADDSAQPWSSEDRTYAVDIEQSIIQWAGRNPNTKHFGTIGLSRGEIAVKDGRITGSFDIDMNSIRNLSLEGDESQPVLISHLKSDDFFFVGYFPTATFTIENASPVKEPTLSAPNYLINGILELRGVKADLEFLATVNTLPDDQLIAEAHFDIDRTRWKVIYGSSRFFEHLGMHLIFDLISFELKIVAQ
jgi:rhodanese-related sulfurtransferase/polyisoprenoid-binding protein YceI